MSMAVSNHVRGFIRKKNDDCRMSSLIRTRAVAKIVIHFFTSNNDLRSRGDSSFDRPRSDPRKTLITVLVTDRGNSHAFYTFLTQ